MKDILSIIQILNAGTPSILLVGIIIYLVRYKDQLDMFRGSIDELKHSFNDAKDRITWKDTCESMHADIDRRLDTLERKAS